MATSRHKASVVIEAEDRASREVKKAQGAFQRFGNYLRSSFVVTLGDVARTARAAFDLIFDTARLEGQTQALANSLEAQGESLDTFLNKLNEVAEGTVSSADLISSAGKALLLGIPAEEIANLLEVARVSAIATGQDVSQAFNDIATGIGRASPLILDNLGIVVRLEDAYAEYAETVGKSAAELTKAEQTQALLNEVLAVGAQRSREFGEAQNETLTAIQRSQAALANFTTTLGRLGGAILPSVVAGFAEVARQIVGLGRDIVNVTANIVSVGETLGLPFEGVTRSLAALSLGLQQTENRLKAIEQDARDAAGGWEELSQRLQDAAQELGTVEAQAGSASAGIRDVGRASRDAADGERVLSAQTTIVNRTLSDLEQQADDTTRSLVNLQRVSVSFGGTLTEGEVIAGGGKLVNFGVNSAGQQVGRITLPGGGSRLVGPRKRLVTEDIIISG